MNKKFQKIIFALCIMFTFGNAFADTCHSKDGDLVTGADGKTYGCLCSKGFDVKKSEGQWVLTKAGTDGIGKADTYDKDAGVTSQKFSGFPFACSCRSRSGAYDKWDNCWTVQLCTGWSQDTLYFTQTTTPNDTSKKSVTVTSAFYKVAIEVYDMTNMCWSWKCRDGFTMNANDHRCMKNCTTAGMKTNADGTDCTEADGWILRNGERIVPCTGPDVVYAGEDKRDIAYKANNKCVNCPPTLTSGIEASGFCKYCNKSTERWDQKSKTCQKFSVISNLTIGYCSQYVDENDFAKCATCNPDVKKWDEAQKKCVDK